MAKFSEATIPFFRRLVLPARMRDFGQTYGGLLGLVLLILYNVLFTPHFVSWRTLSTNLTQVAPTAIVATGMTLVIATGGIDLSVGSLMAIAGALAPIIFLSSFPPFNNPIIGNALAVLRSEEHTSEL